MKTKLLALGFSLAFLLGNAVYSEPEKDPLGPIHTLEPFVVYPHMVKLLNDQKINPVDFDEIIRSDVEEIIVETRRIQNKIMVTFYLEAIQDVQLVAAAKK